jgi:hypothetical protein
LNSALRETSFDDFKSWFLAKTLSTEKITKDESLGSDYHGFCLTVIIQGFSAVFFAESALLKAAERKLVVNDLWRVDPGVTRFNPFSRARRTTQIIRPN